MAAPAGAGSATERLDTIVERCAPRVAPRTALAIVSVESAGRWWAVGDNDHVIPASVRGPAASIAYARSRVAEGGNIDIGLTQLNSSHLREFGISVDEAFEPCTNVALGMSVLRRAWMRAARRWGVSREALYAAFEAYNGGQGVWSSRQPALRAKVRRYADAVWRVAASLRPPAGTGSDNLAVASRSIAR